jgi:flagellar basal-body rod modification protein FlgD
MAISAIPSSSSASTSLTGRKALADNFETFLNIMMTQLKNQNPMNPTDTNQFTQQLVQYAGIEQQLKSNDYLKTMVNASQTAANAQVASYVGKTITAAGDKAQLTKGNATWYFSVDQDAKIEVAIKDDRGSVVATKSGSVKKGDNLFNWNGIASDDSLRPDGNYTIAITARNSDGTTVPVSTTLTGDVSGVDMTGSEPVLLIGSNNARVLLNNVRSIREEQAPAPKV